LAANPLDSIPILHSNADAPAALFLDFDGHFDENLDGGGPGVGPATTPVYDTDGDETTFSDTELANIQAAWEHVAE